MNRSLFKTQSHIYLLAINYFLQTKISIVHIWQSPKYTYGKDNWGDLIYFDILLFQFTSFHAHAWEHGYVPICFNVFQYSAAIVSHYKYIRSTSKQWVYEIRMKVFSLIRKDLWSSLSLVLWKYQTEWNQQIYRAYWSLTPNFIFF